MDGKVWRVSDYYLTERSHTPTWVVMFRSEEGEELEVTMDSERFSTLNTSKHYERSEIDESC